MKVAYIFATQRHNVSYVLAKMNLPQLEQKRHGVDVVGMFFFEDNNYVLVDGNPIGARLHKVAKRQRHAADGLRSMLLRTRDRRQVVCRRADRLLPRSLQGAVRQHAGQSGQHARAPQRDPVE